MQSTGTKPCASKCVPATFDTRVLCCCSVDGSTNSRLHLQCTLESSAARHLRPPKIQARRDGEKRVRGGRGDPFTARQKQKTNLNTATLHDFFFLFCLFSWRLLEMESVQLASLLIACVTVSTRRSAIGKRTPVSECEPNKEKREERRDERRMGEEAKEQQERLQIALEHNRTDALRHVLDHQAQVDGPESIPSLLASVSIQSVR